MKKQEIIDVYPQMTGLSDEQFNYVMKYVEAQAHDSVVQNMNCGMLHYGKELKEYIKIQFDEQKKEQRKKTAITVILTAAVCVGIDRYRRHKKNVELMNKALRKDEEEWDLEK